MKHDLLDDVVSRTHLKRLGSALNEVVLIVETIGKSHHDTILDAVVNTCTILIQTLSTVDGHSVLTGPIRQGEGQRHHK